MSKSLVNPKNGKVCMSVINSNRKDAILNRKMLVASLSTKIDVEESRKNRRNFYRRKSAIIEIRNMI